jgi:hypothetical protein
MASVRRLLPPFAFAFSPFAREQYDKPTFLDRLIAANKLSANLFSFYLATGSVKGSELMLGGINSKHYKGAITTFSVVTETYVRTISSRLGIG